jgi:regulator of protease activity HflC (stomatin/prohibitin superfamily)
MVVFLTSIFFGFVATFIAVGVFMAFGRIFQFWRILPERTVIVYTNFGKVIGEVSEPGMFFPIFHFGIKAILLPFFGKAYTVTTALQQTYLRNQLVNSEEGAPMGVGVWYEMYVSNCTSFLFQNSDPVGSLRANVATAVSRQLSNLKLGSTYIRKVAFRDKGMIAQIELKVVNRLRQVTAAMRQNGDNQVALIHSDADKKASEKLGQAQAVRPQVVGGALAEVQKEPAVATALFRLLDIKATLKSTGKVLISPAGTVGLLLQS